MGKQHLDREACRNVLVVAITPRREDRGGGFGRRTEKRPLPYPARCGLHHAGVRHRHGLRCHARGVRSRGWHIPQRSWRCGVYCTGNRPGDSEEP